MADMSHIYNCYHKSIMVRGSVNSSSHLAWMEDNHVNTSWEGMNWGKVVGWVLGDHKLQVSQE